MVSQKLVEEVMIKLDRPCTAGDIANYILDNKLLNIQRDSIRNDVCSVLNILRRWCTVEKYPDLHGRDSNKWYLVPSHNAHNTKDCHYCKGIVKAHNRNIAQYMIRSTNRNYKEIDDDDHTQSWGFEDE